VRGKENRTITNKTFTRATTKIAASAPFVPNLSISVAPSDGDAAWAIRLGMAIRPTIEA
jgi:hypothetical protein